MIIFQFLMFKKMPKIAKKKFNPSVRAAPTFGKKKIKVGRRLPRENATNTSVKAKRITMVQQMDLASDGKAEEVKHLPKEEPGVAQPVKSLEELAPQLGHFNENLCRDAIYGVCGHFKANPELVGKQLRTIIPGIGALLIRPLQQTATRNQLKRLLDQMCNLDEAIMRSHFRLFSTYVLTGCSDIRPQVRQLAFEVLHLLMMRYPGLCAGSEEIFHKFLQLLSGQRRPTDNRCKLLDAVQQFVTVYSQHATTEQSLWRQQELTVSFSSEAPTRYAVQLLPSPSAFHFPVLYNDSSNSGESPMAKSAGLVECCVTVCALLNAAVREEQAAMEAGDSSNFNAIIPRVFNAVSQLADVALKHLERHGSTTENYTRLKLTSAFAPLKKCPAIGTNKKMKIKLAALGCQ